MPAAPGCSTIFQEWLDTADSLMAPPLRSAAVSHALVNWSGPDGTCATGAFIITPDAIMNDICCPCQTFRAEGAADIIAEVKPHMIDRRGSPAVPLRIPR